MAQFNRILVANRGEIARRIFRTCRSLGIDTVAVFSDADADAAFVREADVAVRIGPAASAESYLVAGRVLEAALQTGADAIHPGYGFLSENADFAEACVEAGITFIGPSGPAIRAMGLKREAKARVAAAGVPVVPGYAESQLDEHLIAAADNVGFPLLVKASAGGGGKGMRLVRDAGELPGALAAARRESLAAFGDDTLILERYVLRPRHIEVQVLGDTHGNMVHLFERECSIQRRHQKVVEESPSPVITDALRQEMGQAAVDAAAAVDYSNAGTVEFILGDTGEFFFLEMNTRLQVEHPVTEAVTGVDLVAEQIRIAEGSPLRFTQEDLQQIGAAIECRIYAEDPGNDFLPATGTLTRWVRPDYPWLRIDAGIESGDEVMVHYDPMIAKVITYGDNREEARRRMARALREMSLAGITTNRAFLAKVMEHPSFIAGDFDTGFIDEHRDSLRVTMSDDAVRLYASAATLHEHAGRAAANLLLPGVRSGFRNLFNQRQRTTLALYDRDVHVGYRLGRDGRFDVEVTSADRDGENQVTTAMVAVQDRGAESIALESNGVLRHYSVVRGGDRVTVHSLDGEITFNAVHRFPDALVEEVSGGCLAPMPGKIIAVSVAEGDAVEAGDELVVLEAMKMEHRLLASEAGVVFAVNVAVGDQVEADETLVVVQAIEG